METETQNMNWILAGIRESLEKMKEAQEDSECDEVAQDDEVWE